MPLALALADAILLPKLLEYLFPCILGELPEAAPEGLAEMPSIDCGRPDPRLDGRNGGDGLNCATGDVVKLLPAPVGDGGTREEVGDWVARLGSEGPVAADKAKC